MAITGLCELGSRSSSGGPREEPKWQSIARYLSSELIQGSYKPGEILPSENHIAKTTGFARSTVRQAFAHLEKEGFIKRL